MATPSNLKGYNIFSCDIRLWTLYQTWHKSTLERKDQINKWTSLHVCLLNCLQMSFGKATEEDQDYTNKCLRFVSGYDFHWSSGESVQQKTSPFCGFVPLLIHGKPDSMVLIFLLLIFWGRMFGMEVERVLCAGPNCNKSPCYVFLQAATTASIFFIKKKA